MSIAQATIANSNTTILTVASGQNYELRSVAFTNFGAAGDTLSVYIVPQGSTPSNANIRISGFALSAGEILTWAEPLPIALDAGDRLIAIGSTGSLVLATANYEVVE